MSRALPYAETPDSPPAEPLIEERSYIDALKTIARFLAFAGGMMLGIGITATVVVNMITDHVPIPNLAFSPPTIAIIGGAIFLIPATILGFGASSRERRYANLVHTGNRDIPLGENHQ